MKVMGPPKHPVRLRPCEYRQLVYLMCPALSSWCVRGRITRVTAGRGYSGSERLLAVHPKAIERPLPSMVERDSEAESVVAAAVEV